jgi:hypothetical protein
VIDRLKVRKVILSFKTTLYLALITPEQICKMFSQAIKRCNSSTELNKCTFIILNDNAYDKHLHNENAFKTLFIMLNAEQGNLKDFLEKNI